MHKDVTAEDEGVGIYLSDHAAAGCPNVSEDTTSLSIVAKRLEVEVINWRALRLVKCWAGAGDMLNV